MTEQRANLRKYLAELPKRHSFVFNDKTRLHLRRLLYLSATNNGKYLDELFKDDEYLTRHSWQDAYNAQIDQSWIINDHKETDPSHPNSPCARKFRIGEPIYRCLTCGLDDTCALCSDCFNAKFHEGHQLYINICQRENGGVCDCGDPEAWTVPLECQHFQCHVTASELPDDFYDSLLATFEVVMDYIIDVMANANLMYHKIPQTPDAIRLYSDNSSLQTEKYGASDINSAKYALILYNDQVRQQQDAIRRIHLATRKVKEFATMVTREVEAYGKALVLESEDLALLIQRQNIITTTGFNTAIRSVRDIFREETCDEAIKWMEDITSATIFQKYNGFRDLVCKLFVKKWDCGIANQLFNYGNTYTAGCLTQTNLIPMVQSSSTSRHPQYWDFQHDLWDLPQQLCREIQYNDPQTLADRQLRGAFLGSRIQYLLFMDIRFWKSIRLVLHDLYIYVLICNLKFKQIINCQYVDIYPQVAEMFLTIDREAESSLMCSLSTQLFTCPSNATLIIQHGSITTFLAVFYTYITKNVVGDPASVDTSLRINFANLKNRKWCQLFFDISYIVSRNEQAHLIFNSKVLNQIIDVLLLFQGSPTLKRSPMEHVEYESSDYTIYFHAISILSHFVEGIARCINKLLLQDTNKQLVFSVIQLVIERLGEYVDAEELHGDSDWKSDVALEPVRYKDLELYRSCKIIDFEVSRQNVSFIHSLHSFLSWLIELNKFFGNANELEHIFSQYYARNYCDIGKKSYALKIFDYPLRTLVLLSQIKVGFWVRNGFSVRTQMQIYRKSTIRDGGYSRDLYLTQCLVASLPQEVSAATIFSRWELIPWINGDLQSSVYGKETTPMMVEECLLFFINILTDDTHLQQLTGDKVNESRITKEIICALCFKPLSFSELLKEVPDHIASEKKFEYILDIVADFIPPKSHKDVGIYKLKEKYFEEIDPFFVHYSSNKRDELIEVLKKRIHKKTGKPLDQICLKPRVMNLSDKNGIYQKIPRFVNTKLFVEFLKSTLTYVLSKGVDRSDTLLDLGLYLITVCCIYNYEGEFIELMLGLDEDTVDTVATDSVTSLLYQILFQDDYKAYHVKIRTVFKYVMDATDPQRFQHAMDAYLTDFNPDVLSSSFVELSTDVETELERKKRIAEKRKLKILQKFKKQQEKFMANNDTVKAEQSDAEMADLEELNDDSRVQWNFPEEHCILCQMHKEDEPFGVVGYIASSPEFRGIPFNDPYWFTKAFSDNESLDQENLDPKLDPRFSSEWHDFMAQKHAELVIGPLFPHEDGLVEDHHIFTSCSHGMHYSCYLHYYKDTRIRSTQITRKLPEDFDKQEFLCPLCKSLNNCFVPIVSHSNRASLKEFLDDGTDAADGHDNDWYLRLQLLNKVDFQSLKNAYVVDAIVTLKTTLIPSYYQALFVNPDRERNMHSNLVLSLASSLSMISKLGDLLQKPNTDIILLKTIESVEVSLRGVPNQDGILTNQISNQLLTTLRVFNNFRDTVELMNMFSSSKRELKGGSGADNRFISTVEQVLGKLSLLGNSDDLADIILTVDFFEMMVECVSARHLNIKFHSVIRVCYIAQGLQNVYLLLFKLSTQWPVLLRLMCLLPKADIDYNYPMIRKLVGHVYEHIKDHTDISPSQDFEQVLDNEEWLARFYTMVVKITTPFLRKSAIFSFVNCANTKDIDFDKFDSYVDLESDRLCDFLQIPRLDQLFHKFLQKGLVENEIFMKFVTKKPLLILPLQSYNINYPGVVSLLELPERLDDFFTKLYYPSNLSNIKNPLICLHCCLIVDMQNLSLDSQNGECYQHYRQHCFNDDNGIFLLPKNTKLLLIHGDNGSFHDAPYLDPHHELNREGTLGHVMYLSQERYSNFVRSVWLGHDISNYIARALENNVDVGGWETL